MIKKSAHSCTEQTSNPANSRRQFIGLSTTALLATSSGLILGSQEAKAKSAKFKFKLASTWPPKMPILQDAVDLFAKLVNTSSDGELQVKVYAGGELIPPLEVFDAVSQGHLEMGVGSPYYWAGKSPIAQFFSAIPFGLNSSQFNAWLQFGGGQQLWEETYKPFNIVPISFGNTGPQMGGWFKKKVSSVEDIKGLKIRMPGLGGKAIAKLGASVVLLSGSEIYTSLERGAIDATEWINPFHDKRLGFNRAAKYFYYPGWHEPQANLELMVGKKAYNSLPPHLREVVKLACASVASWTFLNSEAQSGSALAELKASGTEVLPFPDEVLLKLKKASSEVVQELAGSSPLGMKVYGSYSKFSKTIESWAKVSEEAYMKARAL